MAATIKVAVTKDSTPEGCSVHMVATTQHDAERAFPAQEPLGGREVDTGITVINAVALAITALAGWPTSTRHLPRYPPPTTTVEGVAYAREFWNFSEPE